LPRRESVTPFPQCAEHGDVAILIGMSNQPVDIDIRSAEAVDIEFEDGVRATFTVQQLRTFCPCASCRGMRERGEVSWPRPGQRAEISVRHAELTGAWGLSIEWSDGHATGIYAWSVLRRWWDAGHEEPPWDA
jgi:DUF971 family protein